MDTNELLLEEWKQNVALYIDQDKRGLERNKMFLTVHAGLLVLYGLAWRTQNTINSPVVLLVFVTLAALSLTIISLLMSKRAHAFILLRILQAMLIEAKLKKGVAPDKKWQTESGIITTFTREKVSFKGIKLSDSENFKPHEEEWQPLIDEVISMGSYCYKPVLGLEEWGSCMGHLKWLRWQHIILIVFWMALLIFAVFSDLCWKIWAIYY